MKSSGNKPTSQGTLSRKLLLQGASWSLFGKVSVVLIGLMVNILVARLLPPADAGRYFLLSSFVGFGTLLATCGLPQVVVRVVADAMGREQFTLVKKMLIKVFALAILASAILLILSLLLGAELFAAYDLPGDVALCVVVALWVAANAQLRLMSEAFRGFKDIRLASIFSGMNYGGVIGGVSLISFLAFFHWYGGTRLDKVVLLSLVSVLIPCLLGAIFLGSALKRLPSPDFAAARTSGMPTASYSFLLLSALPLLVTMLVNYFLSFGDIWILGKTGNSEDIAYYAIAARMVMIVALPLMAINGVVAPVIAEHYGRDELRKVERSIRKMTSIAFLGSTVCVLIFMVAGRQILSGIFGDFYQQGFMILLALSLGQLCNVWAGSCAISLSMTGHLRALLVCTLVAGASMLAGGIWFGQHFGAVGLACWVSVVNAMRNLCMVLTVKYRLGIWSCAHFKWG